MYWAFDGCLKPGSLMLLSYLRHSCWYLLQCRSDMRTEVAGNRGYVSLYRQHAYEVDSSSTLQACRRLRPEVFLVAGGAMSSFVRVVLQALHYFHKMKFGNLVKICFWLNLAVKGLIEFHLRFFSTIIILGLWLLASLKQGGCFLEVQLYFLFDCFIIFFFSVSSVYWKWLCGVWR